MKQILIKTTYGSEFNLSNEQDIKKAYELFLKPEARTIFSNGYAIIGKYIQEILPNER